MIRLAIYLPHNFLELLGPGSLTSFISEKFGMMSSEITLYFPKPKGIDIHSSRVPSHVVPKLIQDVVELTNLGVEITVKYY